jgi:dihydroorotate dehydrogenase
MYKILRFFLFLLPPDTAHILTLKLLRFFIPPVVARYLIRRRISKPVTVAGLHFPNPLGLAAGFDKNAECVDALLGLGFGFVEVGGVTPRAQVGNPLPHVTRIHARHSLLNRGGFRNKGLDYLVERLKLRKIPGILGVNIAPNSDTPNNEAVNDYITCLQKLYCHVDYITVNISCPNSADLVALQGGEHLDRLLQALYLERDRLSAVQGIKKPLFIKIAPDLDDAAIAMMAACFLKHRVDGIVATNTSKLRHGIDDLPQAALSGGLSGAVLFDQALSAIGKMAVATHHGIPIIAVGGIATHDNFDKCFKAGASLAAVYTALVFRGPALIKQLLK